MQLTSLIFQTSGFPIIPEAWSVTFALTVEPVAWIGSDERVMLTGREDPGNLRFSAFTSEYIPHQMHTQNLFENLCHTSICRYMFNFCLSCTKNSCLKAFNSSRDLLQFNTIVRHENLGYNFLVAHICIFLLYAKNWIFTVD